MQANVMLCGNYFYFVEDGSSVVVADTNLIKLNSWDLSYNKRLTVRSFVINSDYIFADALETMVDYHVLRAKMVDCLIQGPNEVVESDKIKEFSISPNPATDFLEISYSDANHTLKGVVNTDIAIFNVLGEKIPPRLISSATPQEWNFRLDVSSLPSGVYFVRVVDKVGKFVKI